MLLTEVVKDVRIAPVYLDYITGYIGPLMGTERRGEKISFI